MRRVQKLNWHCQWHLRRPARPRQHPPLLRRPERNNPLPHPLLNSRDRWRLPTKHPLANSHRLRQAAKAPTKAEERHRLQVKARDREDKDRDKEDKATGSLATSNSTTGASVSATSGTSAAAGDAIVIVTATVIVRVKDKVSKARARASLAIRRMAKASINSRANLCRSVPSGRPSPAKAFSNSRPRDMVSFGRRAASGPTSTRTHGSRPNGFAILASAAGCG